MGTINQLTFVEPNKLEWREVTAPRIDASAQALVRPLAVARCDLDLYIASGLYPMKGPFAFGHEIAGEVVEVGDGVRSFAPGDRVIVPFQINCGACPRCRRGQTNACSSVAPYAAYGLSQAPQPDYGGGLSDLVRVPFADAMLVRIPKGVSMVEAALLSDNATDGYRTVARALAEQPGAQVLVVGGLAQSVGLFAVQAAVALGSQKVVYRDFDPHRLRLAGELGAHTQALEYTPDVPVETMFPIVVEAAGMPPALDFALRSTEPCGRCTSVSAGTSKVAQVPLRQMYMKGATYEVSRVQARAELPGLLEQVVDGTVRPGRIVTCTAPFAEAGERMTTSQIKLVFER